MADQITQFAERNGLSESLRDELRRLVHQHAYALAAPLVGETMLEGALTQPSAPAPAPVPDTPRYTITHLLGRGGMGEVWQAFDAVTQRHVAMKILRPDLSAALGPYFTAEARLTAQLEHPGIVSVHDLGTMPDGRRYFTMEEIAGQDFGSLIDAVHAASPPERWGFTPDGAGLRRLVSVLARTGEAVGYAHRRGVLHLDLKPGNIMIGEFGEVRVVDWGLARHTTAAPGPQRGTPAYMAPEQLRGAALTPATDVYAMGGILYKILSGKPPFPSRSRHPEAQPHPLQTQRPVPDDLRRLCEQALQPDPADRPTDAVTVARELSAWLDGARLRDWGLAVVEQARGLTPRIEALRAQSTEKRRAARALLRRMPPFAPVDAKRPGWQQEAEADALKTEADQLSQRKVQLLQAAFTHQPDLPEAHRALADHYRERHQRAEQRSERTAALDEQLLRHHDRTGSHAAYLSGEGALTLSVDPPDATVALCRGVEQDRRITYQQEQVVSAPLRGLRLPHGRWLLELRAPGRQVVRLPLWLDRAGQWDNRSAPDQPGLPVYLPPEGAIGPGECLVSAGGFTCGGDPDAYSPLPQRAVYVGDFVVQQHPVTNAQYIAFLDDLVEQGDEAEALRCVPRERAAQRGELGAMLYGRRTDGRFELKEDADGHLWLPDWPVVSLDWHSAAAYGRWLAARTGQPWRLPTELEWEKAAGRADGRRFPWGDFLDPTWCCVRRSHRSVPLPAPVSDYAEDISPYGVRGMAGNVRDWCADFFHPQGLPATPDAPNDPALQRAVRGGSWFFLDDSARIASRFGLAQRRGSDNVGFRLVRSLNRPGTDPCTTSDAG